MTTSSDLKTAVIVEDDPDIRRLIAEVLESAGFSTVSVGNGLDGVRAVVTYQPTLTTLDVNMPGIDGFEAARRIRAQSDTYIIMLTALGDEADVVTGLGAGADDYLLKPFRPRELRARVEAVMRRARAGESAPPPPPIPTQGSVGPSFPSARPATTTIPIDYDAYVDRSVPFDSAANFGGGDGTRPRPEPVHEAGPGSALVVPENHASSTLAVPGGLWLRHRDLQLDQESRVVIRGDDELELTRTEFDLLATLLESKRRVRSKADLTLVLRGESYVTSYYVGEADKRAVEAHMTNLRRKIGDNPTNPRYVETVRGVGYRLTSESSAP